MKVYVVHRFVREKFDSDYNYRVFGTMEKAKEYYDKLKNGLYIDYEVKKNVGLEGYHEYYETEKSASYYDDDGEYQVILEEIEVE